MRKVFIVEDHPVMREQYAVFLRREPSLSICGEAASVQSALDQIPECQPDIVIVDISLDGDQDGLDLVRTLRSKHPTLRTLVVSGHGGTLYEQLIVEAGANGYVVKGNPEELITAVYQVLASGSDA